MITQKKHLKYRNLRQKYVDKCKMNSFISAYCIKTQIFENDFIVTYVLCDGNVFLTIPEGREFMIETPKNVRQIGYIDKAHRIYVEDYVISFMKSIRSKETQAAVLLGHKIIEKKEVVTYISGMVLAESFVLTDKDEFSGEMWSFIYDKIKEFYEDEEIVGWMYTGSFMGNEPDGRMVNIHKSNFAGKNVVFLTYDYDENEETFYDFIDNSFIKRNGFYIYYQKNSTMHNYMLSVTQGDAKPEEKTNTFVHDVRTIINQEDVKSKSIKFKSKQPIYAAGMLAAAIALFIGSSVIYNQNSNMESEPPQVAEVMQNEEATLTPDESAAPIMTQPSADVQMPTDAPTSDVAQTPEQTQPPVPVQVPEQTQPVPTAAPEIMNAAEVTEKPVMSQTNNYSFYIVKTGDSLSEISEKLFHSISYVDSIRELNNITDENMIYEGQKLWIPDR